ncbi:hypothetical protein V8F06_010380 [Rhypophila decipiens]
MASTALSSSIIAMVDYHRFVALMSLSLAQPISTNIIPKQQWSRPSKSQNPLRTARRNCTCGHLSQLVALVLAFVRSDSQLTLHSQTQLENNNRQSLFLQDNQNLKDHEIARKALRRMIDRVAEYRTHSTTEDVKGDAEAEELAHDAVDDSNGDAEWQAAGNPLNPYDPMATTCHPAVATRVSEDWVKEPVGNASHTPRLCARLAWPRSHSRTTFAPNPNPNPKSPRTRGPAPKAFSTNYNSGILEEVELFEHFFQNAVKERFSPEASSTNYNSGTGKSGSLSTSSRMPSRGASRPMLADGAGSRL